MHHKLKYTWFSKTFIIKHVFFKFTYLFIYFSNILRSILLAKYFWLDSCLANTDKEG